MKAFFMVVRIIFGVLSLSMLGVTIYLLTQHLWAPAGATAALTALLVVFNIRDVRKTIAESKTS